ncbi:MAG TPA: DMT family transporter [Pseudomonadales bacterium]|nr:DMT family transporter [Pseudomonadales bacterium]
MSVTLVSFCLMAVAARELSGEINTFQILFCRSLLGLVVVSAVMVITRQRGLFSSRRVGLHVFRNLFHFAGQYGWITGIGLLPLAEVFALEFTVPIWTAIIASIFLKERLTLKRTVSIGLGMIGVLIIVKPGQGITSSASFIVLAAAVCYAVAHTSTKSLAATEKPATVLLFMCLVQLPMGLALAISEWQWANQVQWIWLSVSGITALTGHYCMTRAMVHAEVGTVLMLDFLRLPMIATIGVMLYSESFEVTLIIGGGLMLFGNWLNLFQRNNPWQRLRSS